jgi:hypothetical protein
MLLKLRYNRAPNGSFAPLAALGSAPVSGDSRAKGTKLTPQKSDALRSINTARCSPYGGAVLTIRISALARDDELGLWGRMKIAKVKITNFKCYEETFTLALNDGLNVIVGANESGKTTILEAIHLTLTGLLHGRPLKSDLTSYLFNLAAQTKYVQSLVTGSPLPPPAVTIELFFSGDSSELAELEGDGNSEKIKASGVVYRIEFDEENYKGPYEALVAAGELTSIPVEYYTATVRSFARKGITSRSIPIKSALIDSSSARLQNGSDVYVSRIIRDVLEETERASISQAHRKLKEAFVEDKNLQLINERITKAAKISQKSVSISVDLSSQTAWESSLMTYNRRNRNFLLGRVLICPSLRLITGRDHDSGPGLLDGVSSRAHLSSFAGHHYRADKRKPFFHEHHLDRIGAGSLLQVRYAAYNGTPRLRVRPPISGVCQLGRTVGQGGMAPQSLDSEPPPIQ